MEIFKANVAKKRTCDEGMNLRRKQRCLRHNKEVEQTSQIINTVSASSKAINMAFDIYNTFKEGYDAIKKIDNKIDESDNLFNE